MKRLFLALAILCWGPVASAQFEPIGGLHIGSDLIAASGAAVPSAAVLRASFATPGHFASPVADTGQAITVSRASTATLMIGGVLQTASANELRVEAAGALIEAAATNKALRSEALDNAVWAPYTSVVTANQCDFVDGAHSMDSFAGGLSYQGTISSTGTGPFTCSAWGLPDVSNSTHLYQPILENDASTWATCTCMAEAGASCVPVITDASSLCRANTTNASGTPKRSAAIGTVVGALSLYVDLSTGSAGPTCLGGAQWETGAYPSSYIPTAGTAVTRSADVVSVARPSALHFETAWCVQEMLTPYFGRSWASSPGSGAGIFAAGTFASADSIGAWVTPTGLVAVDVYDHAGKASHYATAGAVLAGAHVFTVCQIGAAPPTVTVDSSTTTTTLASADSGATGVVTTNPDTVYLGSDGATFWAGGFVSNFLLCASGDHRACKP